MRRTLLLVSVPLTCLASAVRCLAHGHDHPEHLGHHWDSPAYLHEIHMQLVLMAAVACALALWAVASRRYGKRGRQ